MQMDAGTYPGDFVFTNVLGGPNGRSSTIIRKDSIEGFDLDRVVTVSCREDALSNSEVTENLSISKFTKGDQGRVRKGPHIVLRDDGKANVTLADLRAAWGFFKAEGRPDDYKQATKPEMIKAVKINCVGDEKYLKAKKYVPVTIKDTHPIFRGVLRPTDISCHMSLPILVRKCPVDQAWHHQIMEECIPNNKSNRNALFLNLKADVRSGNFGLADIWEWDTDIGAVIVARVDKKPITTKQVEALAIYHRFVLTELFQTCAEKMGVLTDSEIIEDRKEMIRLHMNRDKFEEFFERLKKERMVDDASWAAAESPYSV